jgi:hypothetical protein
MNLDAVPIWAFFIGTIIFVMSAIEAGYLLGRHFHRQSEDEKESPVSAVAGTVLGLTAFVLAFTFSIVSDRYDTRRGLVREFASAVRTAYQRADFLPEPDRAEAKTTLKDYVDTHLAYTNEVTGGTIEPQIIEELLSKLEADHMRLWDMAVANARKDMNSDVAALYIESINDIVSVHTQRVSIGLQSRIPIGIWVVLIGLTMLGMMGIGYQTGIAGSKRSWVRPILALSFGAVVTLIAALDNPHSGYIKVSQQPVKNVREWMESVETAPITADPGGGRDETEIP